MHWIDNKSSMQLPINPKHCARGMTQWMMTLHKFSNFTVYCTNLDEMCCKRADVHLVFHVWREISL